MLRERFVGQYRRLRDWLQAQDAHDRTRELIGAGLARQVAAQREIASLHDVEFRVHSQFGDDGIIQWLVSRLPSLPRRFVEFGVEDYQESTTRFLMVNNGWRGLVMDGSLENIKRLRRRKWFWRHDLTARACFVTRENVDGLIADWAQGEDIGLLHIDVDGNDYWLWEAVRSVSPSIVIMEYNALFGAERLVTVPYRADFDRLQAHRSGQYFGASLSALAHLGQEKGYALIGTNGGGNNAYFVQRDLLVDGIVERMPAQAYMPPCFRDSRDASGRLDFLSFAQRQALLDGLPVVDVRTGATEPF